MNSPVALVTGGSKGLGAEIVRSLAEAGCDIAFTYREDDDSVEKILKSIEEADKNVVALQADASDFDKAHEVVDRVVDELGSISALVCNAGYSIVAPLWEIGEDDWDEVVDVNLKGTFNYIHAVSPHFIEQRGGKIVSIGSINGLRARKGTASYNAAKAGLTGLVKASAIELGEYNVNVNLVAPGFIETPSQVNTSDSVRELVLSECAIKRLGKPEDIAPMVTFLCSDAANHITGQVIKVDAGQYI